MYPDLFGAKFVNAFNLELSPTKCFHANPYSKYYMIAMAIGKFECPYFSTLSPNRTDFTISGVILGGKFSVNVRFNR